MANVPYLSLLEVAKDRQYTTWTSLWSATPERFFLTRLFKSVGPRMNGRSRICHTSPAEPMCAAQDRWGSKEEGLAQALRRKLSRVRWTIPRRAVWWQRTYSPNILSIKELSAYPCVSRRYQPCFLQTLTAQWLGQRNEGVSNYGTWNKSRETPRIPTWKPNSAASIFCCWIREEIRYHRNLGRELPTSSLSTVAVLDEMSKKSCSLSATISLWPLTEVSDAEIQKRSHHLG